MFIAAKLISIVLESSQAPHHEFASTQSESQPWSTFQMTRCLINLGEGLCEHMECEISSSPKMPLLLLRLCWPRSSLHTGGLFCDDNFWRWANLVHREIREGASRRAKNVEVKLVLRHLSDYVFYRHVHGTRQ
jgi:hypothetical protein